MTRLGRVVLDLAYLRPGSRRQEEEADYIGLLMMAEACVSSQEGEERGKLITGVV